MTTEQIILFSLFAIILAMLLWGRFRHDLIAAAGLFCGVALGVVPEDLAFSGFSNPAVVIVALVLIASRAFENSGVLGAISRLAVNEKRPVALHVALIAGIGAGLSAVINNVAALAMLMPIDVQAARRANRPPGKTLMPLAFATILGGMITLIGTPPNIIASSIRARQLGAPYGMFDFTPVGLVVALAGVAFVALVGWRLVPARVDQSSEFDAESFRAELLVPADSKLAGTVGAELDEAAEQADAVLSGIVRDGERLPGAFRAKTLQAGDLLVVEGSSDSIAALIKSLDLQRIESDDDEDAASDEKEKGAKSEDTGAEIVEAVVRSDSWLVGRTAAGVDIRRRFGIALLGVARSGRFSREQIATRRIAAGDELLISGRQAGSRPVLRQLGLIAVNRVGVSPFDPIKASLAVGLFAAAIIAATTGFLSFATAMAIAVAGYAAFGLVPAREFYSQIEWPVVVMLACLLPLGAAFEQVGGTSLIASGIAELAQGQPPVLALVAIMVVTLTLSDVLNNVATMVITGPVAIDLAQRLDVNPDTFLMGVAISASCAFLTPIGHKNNTLIMGPGGFRFSDYWPMGLPLEIVVLLVSVPMLLWAWPL